MERFAEQKPGIISARHNSLMPSELFGETNDLWAKSAGFCVRLGATLSSRFGASLGWVFELLPDQQPDHNAM
jgi:hypothetical protein